MTKEQKTELARELYENMTITKEQYIELCKLCDELDLSPGAAPSEPEEPSWDDIIDSI